MYPKIAWEFFVDPVGCAEYTLRTTAQRSIYKDLSRHLWTAHCNYLQQTCCTTERLTPERFMKWTHLRTRRRSQCPRRLRRRSSAARLLRVWVRIPRGAWIFIAVSVVFCQVEVSVTDWSLVQRSPTDCGASLCVLLETSTMRSQTSINSDWTCEISSLEGTSSR
jgi:hypothetical protein